MKLNINVTPVYGARTNDHAVCTLLSLDGLNILLDCGWNFLLDPSFLTNLIAIAPTVHAVLLSHPDICHLGALPYATSHLGLTAPVFSTLPVWRMGQMFMYDAFLAQDAHKPFSLFNLDDVDATFDYSPDQGKEPRFTLLKYQQGYGLDSLPNGADVVITPHRAGHMLGGTVWSITKGTESIVYAVHVNHRKDRHLSPTTLVNFSRPSQLLLAATNALSTPENATGEERLVKTIKRVVERGGNVLVPVDTAGRVIELAVQLDNVWEQDESLRDADVPLIVLHALSSRTFDFARSMIEWASDEFMTAFDVSRKNMFQFKHVQLMQDVSELDEISGPSVVLASPVSLERGPSRTLFARWANDNLNAVVLVDRPEPGSIYSQLYERSKNVASHESSKEDTLELDITMGKKVPLQGEELDQWRERERTRKRLDLERQRHEDEEARATKESQEREGNFEEHMEESTEDTTNLTSDGPLAPRIDENEADPSAIMKPVDGDVNEKATIEYEQDVLARLRELKVIPTKRNDTFEFEAIGLVEWDDYGQKVDAVRFIIGEDPGEGGIFEESNNKKTTTDPDNKDEETVPTKHIVENLHIIVRCELIIADCSGISDGDSIRHLVKEVEPRQVTVVAGTENETVFLEQLLKKSLSVSSVIAVPKVMDKVDMSSDVSVYHLSLDDKLVNTVAWNNIGLARIGFVKGRMTDDVDGKELNILGRDDMDTDADHMVMDDDEENIEGDSRAHGTYFVGTIMLNKLKDRLAEAGLKAEYAGGALCVENAKTGAVILVRKVAGQHIILQGSLCEEYFAVQDMLYSELVIPQ